MGNKSNSMKVTGSKKAGKKKRGEHKPTFRALLSGSDPNQQQKPEGQDENGDSAPLNNTPLNISAPLDPPFHAPFGAPFSNAAALPTEELQPTNEPSNGNSSNLTTFVGRPPSSNTSANEDQEQQHGQEQQHNQGQQHGEKQQHGQEQQ